MFFALRSLFESLAQRTAGSRFGSDGMPVVNFFGVCVHEICLSIMLTNISHPAVFAGLVGFDVLENAVCVWFLAQTVEKAKLARRSASVSPSATAGTGAANRRPSRRRRRTTVHAAIEGLPTAGEAEAHGVTYYIAATLLLREVVEIIVPAQTMLVLSAMHYFSWPGGLNGFVQGMDDEAYNSAMLYLGGDLGLEVLVFAFTIVALWFIFPGMSVYRVIHGMLEQRFDTTKNDYWRPCSRSPQDTSHKVLHFADDKLLYILTLGSTSCYCLQIYNPASDHWTSVMLANKGMDLAKHQRESTCKKSMDILGYPLHICNTGRCFSISDHIGMPWTVFSETVIHVTPAFLFGFAASFESCAASHVITVFVGG